MQGCNIRCAYCHNPETQAMHDAEAKQMSIAEVMTEIRKGIPFIRGITVSGGECMLQADELTQLFAAVKASAPNLTCLIDSNGTIPFAHYPQLMTLCDGVMLDVKAWDQTVYQRLTQSPDNVPVKENLRWLLERDKLTEIRIVCVPGEVDVETILRKIAETSDSIGKKAPVRLLRFRPHGVTGALKDHPMPTDEQMNAYLAFGKELEMEITTRG